MGVISVPTFLCCTSVLLSFMVSDTEFLNRNPSLDGSEYLNFDTACCTSSVNLSALTKVTPDSLQIVNLVMKMQYYLLSKQRKDQQLQIMQVPSNSITQTFNLIIQ